MNVKKIYTECKYLKDPVNPSKNDAIRCKIDGKVWTVPLNEANTDYVELMKLVDAGELTIEDAD
tara:strand:+ start:1370 stop:1561 length:192 start_codon:yes stop_codon:yes gene_type:complete